MVNAGGGGLRVNMNVKAWMSESEIVPVTVSPQRENLRGLNGGGTSWCDGVLSSSSIGASSSAEPHFFLEWNSVTNFLFLFRSLAWVTWSSATRGKHKCLNRWENMNKTKSYYLLNDFWLTQLDLLLWTLWLFDVQIVEGKMAAVIPQVFFSAW